MANAKAKRLTKSQIVGELADKTGIAKKDIASVFVELNNLVKRELKKKNDIVVPELFVKLSVRDVKARPAGKRRNPFTGEMVDSPARPASKKVVARAMKKLKELVNNK